MNKNTDVDVATSLAGEDLIVSAGDVISAAEVELVLRRHPAVSEAAVVARPDPLWGEAPCAFVTLKTGAEKTTAEELIGFCREQMTRYKVPKTLIFSDLPKTPAGEIQKSVLREQAKRF